MVSWQRAVPSFIARDNGVVWNVGSDVVFRSAVSSLVGSDYVLSSRKLCHHDIPDSPTGSLCFVSSVWETTGVPKGNLFPQFQGHLPHLLLRGGGQKTLSVFPSIILCFLYLGPLQGLPKDLDLHSSLWIHYYHHYIPYGIQTQILTRRKIEDRYRDLWFALYHSLVLLLKAYSQTLIVGVTGNPGPIALLEATS